MTHALKFSLARTLLCLLALFWLASAVAQDYSIPVSGVLAQPLRVDAGLMQQLPRQSIEARDHGKPARFEGVWLRDVLERAGAPLGKKLRGQNMSSVVLLSARDGYVAVFSLAELDPAFRDKPILLADRRDGQALAPDEGPLRLVVADEARSGRWIRQINHIEVRALKP